MTVQFERARALVQTKQAILGSNAGPQANAPDATVNAWTGESLAEALPGTCGD